MYDLMVYSDEELKKIQKLELACLKNVIEVCDKLNIEYFLIGGSALGAIRHGGFIPWDDDIDIGMTRENYKRFLKEAPAQLSPCYHLQTPYDGRATPYFYTKIRIDNTEFMEYCNRKLSIHHGVYIDVFPFDEVPDDDAENKAHFEKMQKLIKIFSLRQSPDVSVKPESVKSRVKSFTRHIMHVLCKVIPYTWIRNQLEKEATRYNGTNQRALACLNFPFRKKEYILKQNLYPLAKHIFENIVVKIPANYDAYLTTHYNNYMQWPPKDQRFGHKPYRINLG